MGPSERLDRCPRVVLARGEAALDQRTAAERRSRTCGGTKFGSEGRTGAKGGAVVFGLSNWESTIY